MTDEEQILRLKEAINALHDENKALMADKIEWWKRADEAKQLLEEMLNQLPELKGDPQETLEAWGDVVMAYLKKY
jgi:hypothetical protein